MAGGCSHLSFDGESWLWFVVLVIPALFVVFVSDRNVFWSDLLWTPIRDFISFNKSSITFSHFRWLFSIQLLKPFMNEQILWSQLLKFLILYYPKFNRHTSKLSLRQYKTTFLQILFFASSFFSPCKFYENVDAYLDLVSRRCIFVIHEKKVR